MHGMEAQIRAAEAEAPHEVLAPERQTLPLVFASPHSGSRYPQSFIAASRLDRMTLRRSEDSFVDEIFHAAPKLGAPMIRAHGNSVTGASYVFLDNTAPSAGTLRYYLEDIDVFGRATRHGPIEVQPMLRRETRRLPN